MYIPAGLIIGAIIGWVMWWGFSTFDEWSSDRRDSKEFDRKNAEFKKYHTYNERRQLWTRNVDGATLTDSGNYILPAVPPKNGDIST
jgi:hypothetical protein